MICRSSGSVRWMFSQSLSPAVVGGASKFLRGRGSGGRKGKIRNIIAAGSATEMELEPVGSACYREMQGRFDSGNKMGITAPGKNRGDLFERWELSILSIPGCFFSCRVLIQAFC